MNFKTMDSIYFGENGLTSTSANFIANQAKEVCQTIKEQLNNLSFVNGTIQLVGGEETSTSKGVTNLKDIESMLQTICKYNSLIAWLREALKAKEKAANEVKALKIEDWAKEMGLDFPVEPKQEAYITEQDVLDTWSVKDRNRYLTLGTYVSVYGKFVHPKGPYADARKTLKEVLVNPVTYEENGRDTIIRKYRPSISTNEVDKEFFILQTTWRKYQAEYNAYAHKIQLAIDEDTNLKDTTFYQQAKDYTNAYKNLSAKFSAWKTKTLNEISRYKIIIPNDLVDIYKQVNGLSAI